MIDLYANQYNMQQDRSRSKLKIWRYAGLMLTYRCSAACRFCYYHCSPEADGLMTIDTAIQAWTSLQCLAGRTARIHITGGEPFLYFEHLADLLIEAQRKKLPPLDSLETNGSWADNETETREKIRFLRQTGLKKLKISYDPFHAEFINVQTIRSLRAIAAEILGPEKVSVRWEKYLEKPLRFDAFSPEDQKHLLRQMLKEDRCRFTGRAAQQIAPLVADKTIHQLTPLTCKNDILGARGVHIDPDGNVFSGQCSGITLGNLQKNSLENLWQNLDPPNLTGWSTLFNSGPAGFLPEARKAGFQPRSLYASKCHLCADIRRFFFDNRIFLSIIGPKACYGL